MISYYLPSESKIGVGYQVHELANELVRRGHTSTSSASVRRSPARLRAPSRPADRVAAHVPLRHPAAAEDFVQIRRPARARRGLLDVAPAGPVHVRTLHGSCFEEAIHIRGAKERLRMVVLGFTRGARQRRRGPTVVVSRRRPAAGRRGCDGHPERGGPRRFRPASARASPTHRAVRRNVAGRKRGAALAEAFSADVRPECPTPSSGWSPRMPRLTRTGVEVLGRLGDEELAERTGGPGCSACRPTTRVRHPVRRGDGAGLPVVATPNVGARYVRTRAGPG